jgi:hypothetical protein
MPPASHVRANTTRTGEPRVRPVFQPPHCILATRGHWDVLGERGPPVRLSAVGTSTYLL